MIYEEARKSAQAKADATGWDYILRPVYNGWTVTMLPRRENRFGADLDGEVVMCSNLDQCKPGHGPLALDVSGVS